MIKVQLKAMRWLGDSLDAVKELSEEARREAGHQLGRVQQGDLELASNRYRQLANERKNK